MFRDMRLTKWHLMSLLFIKWHLPYTEAAIEEIEATPTNTLAFALGDISMPQFLVLCIVFLIIVLLYATGVVPIEVDLGYFFGTGSGELFPRRFGDEMDPTKVFLNCPLQYVCELDTWANRDDHEYFVEKIVASWFKSSNSVFSDAQHRAFGGGGSCRDMYPCPLDVQEVVGIRIPGSQRDELKYTDSEADVHIDLTA